MCSGEDVDGSDDDDCDGDDVGMNDLNPLGQKQRDFNKYIQNSD